MQGDGEMEYADYQLQCEAEQEGQHQEDMGKQAEMEANQQEEMEKFRENLDWRLKYLKMKKKDVIEEKKWIDLEIMRLNNTLQNMEKGK